MKLNTNSNVYTIVYAVIVVVVVAFLLAFVSSSLQERSESNERNDKKKQILASLNIREVEDAKVADTYNEYIVADPIVDNKGVVVKAGADKDKDGFAVALKDINEKTLPVYVAKVNTDTLYVFPLSGKGLWGAIWGYIALKSDLRTVYGAYFSHASETAGLGALIKDEPFQKQFEGKTAVSSTLDKVLLRLVKKGTVRDAATECDGISGATLTGNGVDQMFQENLAAYLPYLQSLKK